MQLWQWYLSVAFTVLLAVVIIRRIKREVLHHEHRRRIGGDKCGR